MPFTECFSEEKMCELIPKLVCENNQKFSCEKSGTIMLAIKRDVYSGSWQTNRLTEMGFLLFILFLSSFCVIGNKYFLCDLNSVIYSVGKCKAVHCQLLYNWVTAKLFSSLV